MISSMLIIIIIVLQVSDNRVAEAEAIWETACSSTTGVSDTNYRPSNPGTYTANNCKFSSTFVTISAAGIDSPLVTSFTIDQGTVAAGPYAGIGIEGPSASNAPSKGPLQMSVTRTTFGLDAVLRFSGAIPPNSSITLSGNNFSLSSSNANSGGFITAIYIASSTLSLSSGSQFSVSNNKFIAPSATIIGRLLIRLTTESLTVADNSLVNISGNWLGSVNGLTTTSVTLIDCIFTAVTVSGGSVVRIDNNGISNIELQTLVLVSWSHSTNNLALQVSDGSVLSQSGNSVSNVVTHPNSYIYVILWSYPTNSLVVSLDHGSRIILSNNSIENATLGDASSAYIHVVYWNANTITTVSIAHNSSLTLRHNIVSNSSITNGSYIRCLCVRVGGPLRLNVLNSSTVNMDDNAISHSRTNSNINVVELTSIDYIVVTVANRSTLSLSRNMAETTQSGTDTFTVLINLGNALEPSTLLNSELRIDGNSIVNSVAGGYILVVSVQFTSFLVSQNSTFTTNSNIVIGANSSGSYVRCVMFWKTTSPSLAITASTSSQMLMNNNTITTSRSVADAICVTFSPTGTTVIICLTSGALLDVSGNSVLNTTVITETYCLFMGPLALAVANASRFIVSGNAIANNTAQSLVSICYLTLNGTLSRSTLLISNNTIMNTDAPDIAVADLRLLQLSMAHGSSIAITDNTLIFTEIGSRVACVGVLSIAPAFTANSFVSLEAGSSIILACNSAATATSIQQAYFLNATVGIGLGESQVVVHNNSIWARLRGGPALGVVSLSKPLNISGHGSGLAFTENYILFDGECHPIVRIPSAISVDDGSLNISKNYVFLNVMSTECAFVDLGSLSSGRLFVTANTITSSVPIVTLRATSLAIAAGGSMSISSNVIELTSNLFSGSLMMPESLAIGPMAGLVFYNNTVFGPGGSFLIVNVSSVPTIGAGSLVALCGNTVFGDLSSSFMPDRYIAPPSLLKNIVGCRSLTSSKSAESSNSSSASTSNNISSLSATIPATYSNSRSLTTPATDFSLSAPISSSLTPYKSLSVSHSSSMSHSNTSNGSRTQQTEVPTATPSIIASQTRDVTITPGQAVLPLIVPKPVAVETAAKVREVAGVAVAVTAVASITGGQLGVANAMLRLADCSGSSDDDELPILVHPLRFSFGDREYQRNAAAAVSDTLLVPLIVVAIALGPARLLIMWSRSVLSRAALVQIGWPTLLVLPFANLAEGIGVTTVAALGSGEPFGVGMGLVALLVLLTFAGSWVWILARVVPRSRLQLVREEGAAGLGKRRAFLWRIVRPSHRWLPRAPADGSDQKRISLSHAERYGNAVGDKQWYYAEFLSFLCSLTVGVCEGLPTSLCRERAVIALVPSLLQCGLAVLALIPLERFLQSLLALCLVPMYVVVAIKVFSDSASDEQLDTVMAVLSSVGNVIGLVIMSLGLVVGLWEIATSHRSRRLARKANAPSYGRGLDMPLLDNDSFRQQQPTCEPPKLDSNPALSATAQLPDEREATEANLNGLVEDDSNSERATVSIILAQLREFEERLQL